MTRHSSCLLLAVLSLVATTIFFELTDVDMLLQGTFFDANSHHWLVDNAARIPRLVFYDGIKVVLLALTAALFCAALFFGKHPVVAAYRRRLWLTLLSIGLILATSSGLKTVTNVACPAQLTAFGGKLPHVKFLERYLPGQRPAKAQHCFPAGHASGGFAFLSLFFLFKTARNRHLAIATGLSLGWIMGLYKMLIGDHFLSHTFTSMLLAWCIICAIAYVAEPRSKPA